MQTDSATGIFSIIRSVGLIETVEYKRKILRGNAATGITDLDHGFCMLTVTGFLQNHFNLAVR